MRYEPTPNVGFPVLDPCEGKLVHLGMTQAPSHSTLAYANEHRSWEIY
jgi:hypothetical protein